MVCTLRSAASLTIESLSTDGVISVHGSGSWLSVSDCLIGSSVVIDSATLVSIGSMFNIQSSAGDITIDGANGIECLATEISTIRFIADDITFTHYQE